jgi:hypothetical protein
VDLDVARGTRSGDDFLDRGDGSGKIPTLSLPVRRLQLQMKCLLVEILGDFSNAISGMPAIASTKSIGLVPIRMRLITTILDCVRSIKNRSMPSGRTLAVGIRTVRLFVFPCSSAPSTL